MEKTILTVTIEEKDTETIAKLALRDCEPTTLINTFIESAKKNSSFAAMLLAAVGGLVTEDVKYGIALLKVLKSRSNEVFSALNEDLNA